MTNENNKDVPLKNENEEAIYLKKIGERLNLSHRTIEKYIEFMMEEHDAENTTNLIAIVIRKKIIK